MMSWLTEPFEYAFMRQALLASIMIGITCSVLGVFVVLRRLAFLGDAIAHTTLPGLVIAYLNRWNLFVGALITAFVTALGISWISRRDRLQEDTAIGVVFSGMFALGVVLISSTGSYRDFTHMLFGNVLGVSQTDLIAIAVVMVIVLVSCGALLKELVLTTVDPMHARVIGLSTDGIRTILLVLMALAIVTAIQSVGVVLTSAMLITPAATGAILCRRLKSMVSVAICVAVVSSLLGLYLSYYLGTSSGGSIVLGCTGCFAFAAAIRRFQGRTTA